MAAGIDPMHQFEVQPIVPIEVGGYDISFSNSALFMLIAALGASMLLAFAISKRALVPGRLQSVAEIFYDFIAATVRSTSGEEGMRFFPFIFSLFVFILFCNLLGLMPYAFTVTSHIVVTFAMAMFVFLMVIVVGLARHGLRFFSLFAPSGVPLILMPLIVPIEIISFLSRPISLSVRLFANMFAGHTLLKVFAAFVAALLGAGGILAGVALVPFAVNVAITALEFLIAFLQAYVFAVLTSIYLNDALHLHDH